MALIIIRVDNNSRKEMEKLVSLPHKNDAPEILILDQVEKDNYPLPRMEWGMFTHYGAERIKEVFFRQIYAGKS